MMGFIDAIGKFIFFTCLFSAVGIGIGYCLIYISAYAYFYIVKRIGNILDDIKKYRE